MADIDTDNIPLRLLDPKPLIMEQLALFFRKVLLSVGVFILAHVDITATELNTWMAITEKILTGITFCLLSYAWSYLQLRWHARQRALLAQAATIQRQL